MEAYDIDSNELASCLLDLPELAQEVPESRLGDNFIWRKDSHSVKFGLFILFRGQLAPDNGVFREASH